MEGSWEKVAELGRNKIEVSEMARKTLQITGLPEDFALTEKTIAFVNDRYPTVDIEKTLERFVENCSAHGRMYADWQAAFRTWVRMNTEQKWNGVEYKGGKQTNPHWQQALHEGRKFGFREPHAHESPAGYKSALEMWKSSPRKPSSNVIDVAGALKVIK